MGIGDRNSMSLNRYNPSDYRWLVAHRKAGLTSVYGTLLPSTNAG